MKKDRKPKLKEALRDAARGLMLVGAVLLCAWACGRVPGCA